MLATKFPDAKFSKLRIGLLEEIEDVTLQGENSRHISSILVEEKVKIFSYLDVEDRQRLRFVCQAWCAIVDNNFGMKVRIKNSTSDLVQTCFWAIDVELSSMTIPFEMKNIVFSSCLTALTFSNILVNYNLTTFLKACCNIKQLTFTNIVLDIPVTDPWIQHKEEMIYLPELEKLEIKCWTFIDGVMEVMRFLSTRVIYRTLKEVIISSQNPPNLPLQTLFTNNMDIETIHPLLKLLKANERTLRSFTIGRVNFPIILKFHPYATFEGMVHRNSAAFDEEEFPLQLSTLEIHPYFREEWVPILSIQNHIYVLNVGSCNVSRWEDVRDAIVRNSATLEKFSIGGLSFGQIWDCNVFETCTKLSTLSIEISHSHKVNLNSLPSQLQELHVFGPLSKHEITTIPSVLKELQSLKFSHLGRIAAFHEAQDERVTLTVFKSLLQIPKLNTLAFAVCSAVSIEWSHIISWCRNIDVPGITYEEHFYQLHGERFRNGVTVRISEDLNKELLDWEKPDAMEIVSVESSSPSSHSLAISTSFP